MNQDDLLSLHRRAWEAIPWVVNGRASTAERRLVEGHSSECPDCRDELALQRQLHAALLQEPAMTADPEPGLQRLLARIEDAPSANDGATKAGRRAGAAWGVDAFVPSMARNSAATRWLSAAVVVQALALSAVIGVQSAREQDLRRAPYKTLSEAQSVPARATIQAAFAPSMPVGQFEALLQRAGLQVVSGPNRIGVYALAPVPGREGKDAAAAVAVLRADPRVRFAEPLP